MRAVRQGMFVIYPSILIVMAFGASAKSKQKKDQNKAEIQENPSDT
jgi:hypothetical protein